MTNVAATILSPIQTCMLLVRDRRNRAIDAVGDAFDRFANGFLAALEEYHSDPNIMIASPPADRAEIQIARQARRGRDPLGLDSRGWRSIPAGSEIETAADLIDKALKGEDSVLTDRIRAWNERNGIELDRTTALLFLQIGIDPAAVAAITSVATRMDHTTDAGFEVVYERVEAGGGPGDGFTINLARNAVWREGRLTITGLPETITTARGSFIGRPLSEIIEAPALDGEALIVSGVGIGHDGGLRVEVLSCQRRADAGELKAMSETLSRRRAGSG